jgi:hypothetical protein
MPALDAGIFFGSQEKMAVSSTAMMRREMFFRESIVF